jgi:hypothetical protein
VYLGTRSGSCFVLLDRTPLKEKLGILPERSALPVCDIDHYSWERHELISIFAVDYNEFLQILNRPDGWRPAGTEGQYLIDIIASSDGK